MNEVAKESGVAIATLYRYFPSKRHLFAAVMHSLVERLDEEAVDDPGGDPVEAVSELLIDASSRLLERPLLALAMLQSNDVEGEAGGRTTDEIFGTLLLRTAGIDRPTERDRRLVRLLGLSWYGVLMSALYGRRTEQETKEDIRLCAELLLATRSTA